MRTIVAYVSGHGFGHAVRVIEVLRALRRRAPEVRILMRTPLGRAFFDDNLAGSFDYGACRLDVGAVQSDSLTVDVPGSLRAYAEILRRRQDIVGSETETLAAARPDLVLADIPGLAFDVAHRLSLPAVAMTNFSWDWIYADYVRDFPEYAYVVDDLRESYGHASLLLRLPMHGDLSAFPTIRDIPFVARRATLEPADVRRRLGLPPDRRIVLLSFGGIGVALTRVPEMPGILFVSTHDAAGKESAASCRVLSNRELGAAGVRYEDLVRASDVILSKPGYGIVAECIANGTAMVYTSRGRFAEYPRLVEGIRAHLPNAFLDNEALRAGRWQSALEAVLDQPRREPTVALDGAEVAAEALLKIGDR